MSGATPFLVAGLLLIILLIFSLLRGGKAGSALSEPAEDGTPHDALLKEPLLQELEARLFGSQDYDYMAKQGPAELRRLFLNERSELALSWVQCVRAHANKLIRVHRIAARRSSQLAPMVEVRVAVNYLLFEMLCQLVALVIWVRGPADLGRLIGYVDGFSGQLSEVVMRFSAAGLGREKEKRPV